MVLEKRWIESTLLPWEIPTTSVLIITTDTTPMVKENDSNAELHKPRTWKAETKQDNHSPATHKAFMLWQKIQPNETK